MFSKFVKIFIELGDTAPQSWTNLGNFRKIQDPSTGFTGFELQKCSPKGNPKGEISMNKKSVVNFLTAYSQSSGVVWSSYLVSIGLYTNFS